LGSNSRFEQASLDKNPQSNLSTGKQTNDEQAPDRASEKRE
jgi:hypothetical protein